MTVVVNYKNDCFVSYSHLDNIPFGDPLRPGWVAIFHENLQNFVNVHVGRPITIWRDLRLTGAEVFSDEIEQQLRSSAILISIISPGYLRSDWCNRELLGFTKFAEETHSLRVGNLQRVVKVLRLPVERSALPPMLDEVLGAQFYSVDPQTKRARDLLLEPGSDKAYLARVDDVAQDVKRLLEAVMSPTSADRTPGPADGDAKAVFLAWTTSDLADERERLRRDLEARGFRVIPTGEPPLQASRLSSVVLEALQTASVAIHLVGSHYGFVPEGEDRSVVELQGDDATYRLANSQAARIFWLADSAILRDARLSAMIEQVQEGVQGSASVDIMTAKSIEELKTLILDRLNPLPRPEPLASNASRLVYLICDQLDRTDVAAVRNHLFDASIEVRLPLFAGDVTELRDEHEALLKECDGVLIYWGQAKEAWLRKMLRDINRVFGSTSSPRIAPYKAACLYIAGPPTDSKVDYLTHELPIIRQDDEIRPDVLRSFISCLKGA
jgi:hypothetical protein